MHFITYNLRIAWSFFLTSESITPGYRKNDFIISVRKVKMLVNGLYKFLGITRNDGNEEIISYNDHTFGIQKGAVIPESLKSKIELIDTFELFGIISEAYRVTDPQLVADIEAFIEAQTQAETKKSDEKDLFTNLFEIIFPMMSGNSPQLISQIKQSSKHTHEDPVRTDTKKNPHKLASLLGVRVPPSVKNLPVKYENGKLKVYNGCMLPNHMASKLSYDLIEEDDYYVHTVTDPELRKMLEDSVSRDLSECKITDIPQDYAIKKNVPPVDLTTFLGFIFTSVAKGRPVTYEDKRLTVPRGLLIPGNIASGLKLTSTLTDDNVYEVTDPKLSKNIEDYIKTNSKKKTLILEAPEPQLDDNDRLSNSIAKLNDKIEKKKKFVQDFVAIKIPKAIDESDTWPVMMVLTGEDLEIANHVDKVNDMLKSHFLVSKILKSDAKTRLVIELISM